MLPYSFYFQNQMSAILQFLLVSVAFFDFSIFCLSNYDGDKFLEIFPHYASSDPKFCRVIGSFFLLAGIVRLHGATNITEKGAYRVALWSWVVEILYHIIETYHGQYDIQHPKMKGTIAACCAMLIFSTIMYKSILYPKSKSKTN